MNYSKSSFSLSLGILLTLWLLIAMIFFWLRLNLSAWQRYLMGKEALNERNLEGAITEWELAALQSAPLNYYGAKAYERLVSLAKTEAMAERALRAAQNGHGKSK